MLLFFLKLSGSILIMLSSVCLSKLHCRTVWKKAAFFDGLISGFSALREQVCTCLAPIDQALSEASASAGDASFVFSDASKTRGNMSEKFSFALKENPNALKCILPLSQGLISSDTDMRLSSFSRINQALSDERSRIAQEARSAERLFTAAGPLTGIGIIILLI